MKPEWLLYAELIRKEIDQIGQAVTGLLGGMGFRKWRCHNGTTHRI